MSASQCQANLKTYTESLGQKLKKDFAFETEPYSKVWVWKNLKFTLFSNFGSSRSEARKGALRNFARPAALLKKRLWHRCFLLNFAKFLRTPFLWNTSGGCPSFHITINSSLSSISFDLPDVLILRNIKNLSKSCFSSL